MTKRILIPVDLSDTGTVKQLIGTGEKLASPEGASIDVLTVIPSYGMPIVGSYFPDDFEKKSGRAAQEALDKIIAEAATNPDAVAGHVRHGTIYDQIIRTADELGCDLIVMKSHRPELRDYLLGPNSARVVRHAKQSVFVVRD